MTNCHKTLEKVSDIVDKRASFFTRMMFYMHLAMCYKCRLYFKQYLELRSITSQVSNEDLPGDFSQIMEKTLAHLSK